MRHATGFLTPEDYEKLKELARADDKSLARYVTRLLEKHIQDKWEPRHDDTVKAN